MRLIEEIEVRLSGIIEGVICIMHHGFFDWVCLTRQ